MNIIFNKRKSSVTQSGKSYIHQELNRCHMTNCRTVHSIILQIKCKQFMYHFQVEKLSEIIFFLQRKRYKISFQERICLKLIVRFSICANS